MNVTMATENTTKLGFFGRIKKFFSDQRSEMKKIVWPSKKQLINNTIVVLVAVGVASIAVGGFDAVLSFFISLFLGA